MCLIGYIDLKMQMIPIRIPRISDFSNYIARFDYISCNGICFKKMSIIGIDSLSIRKCMFYNNCISPTCLPSSRNYRSITDRTNRCSLCGRDIHSFMTSISDIPSVSIRRSVKHRIDTTIFGIILVFRIIGSYDTRKRHSTTTIQCIPWGIPTCGFCNLIQRIHKTACRSALYTEEKEREKKNIFFHSDFLTKKKIYDNITLYRKICKQILFIFLIKYI